MYPCLAIKPPPPPFFFFAEVEVDHYNVDVFLYLRTRWSVFCLTFRESVVEVDDGLRGDSAERRFFTCCVLQQEQRGYAHVHLGLRNGVMVIMNSRFFADVLIFSHNCYLCCTDKYERYSTGPWKRGILLYPEVMPDLLGTGSIWLYLTLCLTRKRYPNVSDQRHDSPCHTCRVLFLSFCVG